MIKINITKENQTLMEAHLKFVCAQPAIGSMKMYPLMVKGKEQFSIKISQHIEWKERYVQIVESHEFMDILKHLVKEKKDLQERLDIMEEILHSYLPVIEKDEE